MNKAHQEIIRSKARIFHALALRFIIGRYGRDNIGFMWTFVEPLILCLGVMVIWSFTKGSYDHGVEIVAFVFTGYMPLTLWRHQTGLMVNILKNVKFLTIFHGLTIFDAMISRSLLEFISVSGASMIVYFSLQAFGALQPPHEVALIIQGWLLLGLVGFGFGLLVASASETTEVVERIMQPFQYFLLPLCGAFYMVDWLPAPVQQYALYIPMVHCYEMIRAGYFGPTITTNYSLTYPLFSGIIMAGIGCFIFERVKNHVEA